MTKVVFYKQAVKWEVLVSNSSSPYLTRVERSKNTLEIVDQISLFLGLTFAKSGLKRHFRTRFHQIES